MEHIVDKFLKKTRCNNDRSYVTKCLVCFSYCELAITLFFVVSTYISIVYSKEDLSVRFYGLLCFFIECHIFVFIAIRLYHQSQFCDLFTLKVRISENLKQKIVMIIKHHIITSNIFVAVSMLYTISTDRVQIGDPFTFPFIDVLPIKTTNLTIYLCKYILYALLVYIAHFEICFLNVTFMYSTGVVNRYFQVLVEEVEGSVINKDEQKLKIAIKRHQEVLKYFIDIKTVHEKSILLIIEICGVYIGLTTYFSILVIQGYIHQIILGLCIISSLASIITIIIYCVCTSNMYYLHDGLLNALYEPSSCYSRNNSFNRLILIMMTRAKIPLEFKAGSVFTINLNLLVKILKSAYTVFNVLLTSANQ